MSTISIHVMHAGKVCVAPALPFGGSDCNPLKASGVFGRPSNRIWLPVSTYLVEHPKGRILVDAGWHREMSPNGRFDRRAQIRSLGSIPLYLVNQGLLPEGEAVDEQLAERGIAPADLDFVLATHLDCDHVNGLKQVAQARRILASRDEVASVRKDAKARIRYNSAWWEGTGIEFFDWNGTEGPVGKSYDVFGDGSVACVAIPGHADGMFAVRVRAEDGRFVLLFADGGYASRSWQEMIEPGIANDRVQLRASLAWIREQSLDPLCVASLANHDDDVEPHTIKL